MRHIMCYIIRLSILTTKSRFGKNFRASDKRERDRISDDKSCTHVLPALADMCWLNLGFHPFFEKRKITRIKSDVDYVYNQREINISMNNNIHNDALIWKELNTVKISSFFISS